MISGSHGPGGRHLLRPGRPRRPVLGGDAAPPFLGAAGGLAGGTRAGGAAGLPRPAGQGRWRVRHRHRGPLVTVIVATIENK